MGIKIDRIDHVVLTVKSLDAAIAFYCDILGMQAETFGDGRHCLRYGNQKINLHTLDSGISPRAELPTCGSLDICLIVSDDMEHVVRWLLENSVPIVAGPATRTGALGEITSIYIRDPDGNLIELSRYVDNSLNGGESQRQKSAAGPKVDLPIYDTFEGTELPDPRVSHYSEMIAALVDIVAVEGPATVRTVLDRYRVGAGYGKLRGPTKEALVSALGYATTSRRIVKLRTDPEDASGDVVALPETPTVRLRERGPRDLDDIPVDEIAQLVRRLEIDIDSEDDDAAFRLLLDAYGLKRLTETARVRLKLGIEVARQSELPAE